MDHKMPATAKTTIPAMIRFAHFTVASFDFGCKLLKAETKNSPTEGHCPNYSAAVPGVLTIII